MRRVQSRVNFLKKANEFVRKPLFSHHCYFQLFACACLILLLLAACGGGATSAGPNGRPRAAAKQVLVFPNVGVQDLDTLDPAEATDTNSTLAISMIYSGLVRQDQNLEVVPDQATWAISPDHKTYTFHLKPGITFSDGTPLTAQTYVYSLTRALSPNVDQGDAMLFLGNIVGAPDVNAGRTKTLSGVKALDASTLTITLSKPTEYFLQALASPLAFAVNQKFIARAGKADWSDLVAGNGAGSGPFMVKEWQHNTKLVLVPNPRYYGKHTRLSEVDMIFVVDAHTAFQAYQGGQYSFVWNILPEDLNAAHGLSGFSSQPQLETDAIFFNTQMPPFDQAAVRQAFAYAINKTMLAQSVLNNSAIPAPTIVPAGIPGYQPPSNTLPFSRVKALNTLHTAYADVSQVPPVTFSYPSSIVSASLAGALQQMWQAALGIPIKLLPVETDAYANEMANHQIQLGFEQWFADFPDPYDALTLTLASNAPGNSGLWQNNQFDALIQQAEQTSGSARLALYAQAEQVAISDAGLLPLDHRSLTAVIPATVHGVILTHMGLYFGDWSNVYLSQH